MFVHTSSKTTNMKLLTAVELRGCRQYTVAVLSSIAKSNLTLLLACVARDENIAVVRLNEVTSPCRLHRVFVNSKLELCADVIVSAAARWSISVGGGVAPPVQKNRRRRRRDVSGQKQFFLRFTKKFRSILKIFLGTFLLIKALRFADDQC